MTTGRINQIATVVYVRVRTTPACESGNCSLALSLGLLRRRNVFLGLAASVLVRRLLLRAFRRWATKAEPASASRGVPRVRFAYCRACPPANPSLP
ncbi:hypothetical protein DPMN_131439 [Dreissena polymorpha]|jgi:hypothetical protein|uniref:Uncharacterized protein n=1 Tax=Dreissena polymorpha TaxID=45954 RepID=A0A9D4H8C7_DREPO|nr:hypothetical protein DPMN_131350 [Dreissena polymorpha]KAH3829395.1 hypothetical protein DPMN_131391 [Dreissena polymorpha]KAH3829411.1 hypothetical protein DPMN_131407 [Dreissena polymorpha]KAH3829427.1 hypothetical protein DPMN_131423 [Dreissena polymorpha]KAH3829443.1 hypothetical protein DPMN_131439 [Dreissena polymorpha]